MKSKKMIALFTSSLLATNIVCPVYATDTTDFEDIDISEEEIENEQKKDEEFDEEYGLEDSDVDGDPFIDDQDKHYCCRCHCCIEEPDPEEDEAELICEDCSAELTKEKAEANAKELADMISDFESLKVDDRFELVKPSNREELKNGDVMMLADALYIYVYLSDEIYTWYKVTNNGLEETPNLRFSDYASYYRVIKNIPAYSMPEYLVATQGTELSKVKLPHGFEWQETDITLDELGNQSFLASYTPDNLILFKKVSNIKINVLVKKKTLDMVYPDGRYMLNYTPGLTLESVPLPDGWSFEKPKKNLDVGSGIYTAYFTPDEEYDYNQSTEPVQIRVDVEKASMFVDDIYIEVLAGTILTDDLLPKINDGTLEWDIAERIATMSSIHTCHFSPNDIDRYCMTKDIPVHVTVKSANAVEEPTESKNPIVSEKPSEMPTESQSPTPSEKPSDKPSESEKPSEKPEESKQPEKSETPNESSKPSESVKPSTSPSQEPSPEHSKDPDKTFKPLTPIDKYEFVDKEENMLDITSISKFPIQSNNGTSVDTSNEIYTSNGNQSTIKPSSQPEQTEDINNKDDSDDNNNSGLIISTTSPTPTPQASQKPITSNTPKPSNSSQPSQTPTTTVQPTKSPNNNTVVATKKPSTSTGSLTVNSGTNSTNNTNTSSNSNSNNNTNSSGNTVSLNNITIGSSSSNKTQSTTSKTNSNSFTVVSTTNKNTSSLSTSGSKTNSSSSNTVTVTTTKTTTPTTTTTVKTSPSPSPSVKPSSKPNSLSSITVGSHNSEDEDDPTVTVTSSTETTGKNQLTVVLPSASPSSENGTTTTETNGQFAGLQTIINNETVPTTDKPTIDVDSSDEDTDEEDDENEDEDEKDKKKDKEDKGEKKGISIKVIIPIVIIVVAIGVLIFIKRR